MSFRIPVLLSISIAALADAGLPVSDLWELRSNFGDPFESIRYHIRWKRHGIGKNGLPSNTNVALSLPERLGSVHT